MSAEPDASPSVSVIIHPLVLINISDHYTRLASYARQDEEKKRQESAPRATRPSEKHDKHEKYQYVPHNLPEIAIGLLLGNRRMGITTQVEIHHSFELKLENKPATGSEPAGLHVDLTFLDTRMRQYRQVFPHLSVVGWYSTTNNPSVQDAMSVDHISDSELGVFDAISRKLLDNPMFLHYAPKALMKSSADSKQSSQAGKTTTETAASHFEEKVLPLAVFEYLSPQFASSSARLSSISRKCLVPLEYSFASEASERVSIEHVSHNSWTKKEQMAATQAAASASASMLSSGPGSSPPSSMPGMSLMKSAMQSGKQQQQQQQQLSASQNGHASGYEWSQYLENIKGAVLILNSRLTVICKYLENVKTYREEQAAVAQGAIASRSESSFHPSPADYTILRSISSLCYALHRLDSGELLGLLRKEQVDTMSLAYLSGLTKVLCEFNDLIDKFNMYNRNRNRQSSF